MYGISGHTYAINTHTQYKQEKCIKNHNNRDECDAILTGEINLFKLNLMKIALNIAILSI